MGPSYNLPLKIPAIYTTKTMADVLEIPEEAAHPIPPGGMSVTLIQPEYLPISLNIQNYFHNDLVEGLYIYYEMESSLAVDGDIVFYISNDEHVYGDDDAWTTRMGTNEGDRISLNEFLSLFGRPVFFAVDLVFETGGEISGENYVTPNIYLEAVIRVNQ